MFGLTYRVGAHISCYAHDTQLYPNINVGLAGVGPSVLGHAIITNLMVIVYINTVLCAGVVVSCVNCRVVNIVYY